MNKQEPVSMKAIAKLLDLKLAENNKSNNEILLLQVGKQINDFRKETNESFDGVFDRLQDIIGMIEDVSEKKIQQLRGSLKTHLAQI